MRPAPDQLTTLVPILEPHNLLQIEGLHGTVPESPMEKSFEILEAETESNGN